MLKTFFNSDLRAGKKYRQQFSNGDSAQRLHVLNQINEAKATGSLNDIPPELQLLFNNALTGSIPLSWCHLPKLWFLDVQHNQLDGTLPQCLAQMKSLGNLLISFNK